MVETQLADEAPASPPAPRGQRAGGPHAAEGITTIGQGVVIAPSTEPVSPIRTSSLAAMLPLTLPRTTTDFAGASWPQTDDPALGGQFALSGGRWLMIEIFRVRSGRAGC